MELHELVAQRESEMREAGQRAFEEGKGIGDCPHRNHTREADLWRRGFANALFGAQLKLRP
jgi:hypothetical protein